MLFSYNDAAAIPLETGQAVSPGWPSAHGGQPHGVTWHWTVTGTLKLCRDVLGGRSAERRGEASAHYGVGRSFSEGVDRYVSLENRSWHAGKNQLLRWDGKALTGPADKGTRTTIGVETVNLGYATDATLARPDWISALAPDGKRVLRVQPWTEEQIVMMIEVGREILKRWPHIRPEQHHGHHDLCPGYKVDVCGFPFARVLRGIYDTAKIPDVWSTFWSARPRQRALLALGYNLGPAGADGLWGSRSDAALRRFQREHKQVENGLWTTFTNWAIYRALRERDLDLETFVSVPVH